MNGKHGSVWRRWDLHVHAPGTKLSNGFGDPSDDNLEMYVRNLEESDVQVFGITDYFSADTFFEVKMAYRKVYPNGRKLFIPIIELRLAEIISNDGHVHIHVLIDPDAATEENLRILLSGLKTHITRDGASVRCSELKSSDYRQATVALANLREVLKEVFPNRNSYMIVTAANNDGLMGVDTNSERSVSISDEIDKASDAFFGSSRNTEHFLKTDRYEDHTPSQPKPVFAGSDAHSFNDLARLSGDEAGYEATWIKADLTFRGLRQTLFEPKGRAHIGERPTVLLRQEQDATRFMTELRIDLVAGYSGNNGSWFKNVVLPFSPELTVIIGNKGSGKSAVADILGLLGESRQSEHFSFLINTPRKPRFRQKGYAENFFGSLSWASDRMETKSLDREIDIQKPEIIKYY